MTVDAVPPQRREWIRLADTKELVEFVEEDLVLATTILHEQEYTGKFRLWTHLYYNVLGTARLALGMVPLFFGTALHVYTVSFCRAGLKIGTGPSTGAILTAYTDFFHGTAERLTCLKAGTARLIGVPRPRETRLGLKMYIFLTLEFTLL